MIDYLQFRGTITDGTGLFSQLVMPGRADVFDAPVDWPAMLTPGTLSASASLPVDRLPVVGGRDVVGVLL